VTTISTNKTLGVVLNPGSYTNPIVINSGVTIADGGTGYAISYGGSHELFTIENSGTVAATGKHKIPVGGGDTISSVYGGSGISLANGGSI
jgi:hypothetical protein